MKKYISKFLVVVAFAFSSYMVRAQNDRFEEVTILARIHSAKDVEALSGYAVEMEQEGLSKLLSELEPDDEVLIKGSVKYNPITLDNKTDMRPTFYINKIIPVSLKRLGKSEFEIADPKLVFSLKNAVEPNRKGIPVSGKVATAITLTATVLLMQNLSNSQGIGNPREVIQSQLFFSAGVLATGLFIWEQFQKGHLK